MTYRLAALRLRSIGERSARFTDLTLDLTGPAPDTPAASPQDSIIWLRNGGGKSSILSLLYAQLLPHARDFMGRAVQRSLTDYVEGTDTAHVICVWHPYGPNATLLGDPEHSLVTGAVYEWHDLRRPARAEESRDRLEQQFYVFHAIPDVLDLASLPMTDEEDRPLRLAAYIDAVKERARPFAKGTNLAVTDKQHIWARALSERHLDTEMFRSQKQMNHVEGGVEDLFKFPAAKDFVEFLLDLATAPDAPAGVATRLSKISELIAAKPRKRQEHEFCTAASFKLDAVADGSQRLSSAHETLATATAQARTLAAAFDASLQATEREQQQRALQSKELEGARTSIATERSSATDLAYLYRREAARLSVKEAHADRDIARDQVAQARSVVQSWEAALAEAHLAGLEHDLEQATLEAVAEEEEIAPLRQEVARRAATLRRRLASLADQSATSAQQYEEQQDAFEHAAADSKELADQANTARIEAAADLATAQANLDAHGEQRRQGVSRRYLPSASSDPVARHDELAAQLRGLESRQKSLSEQAKDRRRQRNDINTRQITLTAELTTTDTRRTETARTIESFQTRLAELTSAARVRALVEAAEDETVDLWAESDVLLRRLQDAVLAADNERIHRRAEQHADRRTIESQERDHVLPSSLDAERIMLALTSAGLAAQTGWTHLRSLLPVEHLLAALENPVIARLGCGVVVPEDQADEAAQILHAGDATTTSWVAVYSAAAATRICQREHDDESDPPPVWRRLQPGLVDAAEAEAAVTALKDRARTYQLQDQELARKRDADARLHQTIADIVATYPANHLDRLRDELDALDAKLRQQAVEQESNRIRLEALDDADLLAESEAQNVADDLMWSKGALVWLDDFAREAAEEPVWLERRDAAQGRMQDAGARYRKHTEDAQAALVSGQRARADAARQRDRAADYNAECEGIANGTDSDEGDDEPQTPLDALRRGYERAQTAVTARAAESVLADRVNRLEDQVSEAKQQLARRPPEARAHAQLLLTSPAGQDAASRHNALEHARTSVEGAVGKQSSAETQAQRLETELAHVEQLHAQPPRRTLPNTPTTSEEASLLREQQEVLAQEALRRWNQADELIKKLDHQREQAHAKMTLLSTLSDSLPSPQEVESPEFHGDETRARAETTAARSKLAAAQQGVNEAESELNTAVDGLRRTASRFTDVTGPMRDRVINDPPDLLGRHAAALARRLRLRAQTLNDELDSIATDQTILSEALAALVKESLSLLGKAERASQMTTASGSWSGQRVLRIRFDRPADHDLVAYSERVIDRVVRKGLKPEGMALLKEAVHEAAGPRGFSVKVLKPTDDDTGITEDISRLAKWSGGEKLTVCVALYCTLAALRAAHTGRHGTSGGVLLLDNPIGRASSAPLIRLQRNVAASHGVQLVYTTGVKDPAAVIQFPNIIRLDNREGRTKNRRYIVPDTPPLDPNSTPTGGPAQRASIITGIRVAHRDNASKPADPKPPQADA